jgi:ATP-binding cassette subfamily B protein
MSQSAAYVRKSVLCPQDIFLFSGTIRENIAFGYLDAPLEQVVGAAMLAGAHEFISELPLGYETKIGERGQSLSGGQKQRIAIARALFRNPRILIFDEATSALDTESESAIQKNLNQILKDRTTLIIAHRLSTVRNADVIVVMDRGTVREIGNHNSLMKQKAFTIISTVNSLKDRLPCQNSWLQMKLSLKKRSRNSRLFP